MLMQLAVGGAFDDEVCAHSITAMGTAAHMLGAAALPDYDELMPAPALMRLIGDRRSRLCSKCSRRSEPDLVEQVTLSAALTDIVKESQARWVAMWADVQDTRLLVECAARLESEWWTSTRST